MKKKIVIVDTNVPITANGQAEHASLACRLACIKALQTIRAQRRIALDESGLILQEYRNNLSLRGQPGVGDAFFKWLWDNQANRQICAKVPITYTGGDQEFAEFPADPRLHSFDRSDRKFVAVARVHPDHPPIINAVDTDWHIHQQALAGYHVVIEEICPDDIRRLAVADQQ